MRLTIALVALALAGCMSQPARQFARGGGIVSTNPCSDQLIVALAPDKVAAISHYSQAPGATSMPLAVANRYRATAGTAEEVIALKPDLVLASTFTQKPTLEAYRRAGLKVMLLDSPTTIAASEQQIRDLAVAVGVPARGEALVARIERAVAAAAPRDARRPAALLYISGSFANGGPSLLTELIERAGLGDASKGYGLAFSGSVPIETIAARPPALLLEPDPYGRIALLRRGVVARSGGRMVEARFPRQLINCGGTSIPRALRVLADARARVLS